MRSFLKSVYVYTGYHGYKLKKDVYKCEDNEVFLVQQ